MIEECPISAGFLSLFPSGIAQVGAGAPREGMGVPIPAGTSCSVSFGAPRAVLSLKCWLLTVPKNQGLCSEWPEPSLCPAGSGAGMGFGGTGSCWEPLAKQGPLAVLGPSLFSPLKSSNGAVNNKQTTQRQFRKKFRAQKMPGKSIQRLLITSARPPAPVTPWR